MTFPIEYSSRFVFGLCLLNLQFTRQTMVECFKAFTFILCEMFPLFYLCENPLKCMFLVRSLNITSYLRKSLQRGLIGRYTMYGAKHLVLCCSSVAVLVLCARFKVTKNNANGEQKGRKHGIFTT